MFSACESSREEPVGFGEQTTATAGADGTGTAGATESTDGPTPAEEWAIDVAGEPPEAPADLAVYEAYLEYWRADLEALSIPDAAYQPLLDHTVDPQRARVVSAVEQRVEARIRTIGTLRVQPFVVSVSGPTAAIQDCMDGRETFDVDAGGEQVPDSRGELIPVVVDLIQADGGWVVSDVREAQHECS